MTMSQSFFNKKEVERDIPAETRRMEHASNKQTTANFAIF